MHKGALVKGTRLYKPAGSPLIQGRSRRERSYGFNFTAALLVGTAVSVAAWYLVLVGRGFTAGRALALAAVPSLIGAVAGAPLGVSLATLFGWHPRWIAGALLGGALALGATWGYLTYVVA